MTEPLARVPARVRRVAMRHLESLRRSPLDDRRLADADLAPDARPMYRPDVRDVAYWEFGLVAAEPGAGTSDAPGNGGGQPGDGASPFGFIVVSTGEHDFPIPHWSLERPPPSRALEQEAGKRGKAIGRIYRLDALAYLAEDDAGDEVARSGQVPAIVERATAAPAAGVSSMVARARERRDDAEADRAEFAVERQGPADEGVRVIDTNAWGRLKERYAEAFGPMLADVRRNAGRAWQIDRDVEEFGEGIMAGEAFSVGLLERGARVDVVGEGKGDVTIERDDKRRGPPILRGRTQRRSHEKERGFEIRIEYDSGERETLRYFLVSRETRSNAPGASGGGDPE